MDKKRYDGNIKNVSETGLCYMMSGYLNEEMTLAPNRRIKLILADRVDNVLNLDCRIVWYDLPSKDSPLTYIGLKVIKPSSTFAYFVKALEGGRAADDIHFDADVEVVQESFSPQDDYYLLH